MDSHPEIELQAQGLHSFFFPLWSLSLAYLVTCILTRCIMTQGCKRVTHAHTDTYVTFPFLCSGRFLPQYCLENNYSAVSLYILKYTFFPQIFSICYCLNPQAGKLRKWRPNSISVLLRKLFIWKRERGTAHTTKCDRHLKIKPKHSQHPKHHKDRNLQAQILAYK